MGWLEKQYCEKKHAIRKEDIWVVCESCGTYVYKKEWIANLHVCPRCNFHGKLTPNERIDLVFDAGSFEEFNEGITPCDPIGFVDQRESYSDKVESLRLKMGQNESVITGTGRINGVKVVAAIMDFRFLGGSLGSGTGEKIFRATNLAYDEFLPYIIFSASSGARMQEGTLSLMQMAKTSAGLARLSDARLPFISVLTDPTTGGGAAGFAVLGDVIISEPG